MRMGQYLVAGVSRAYVPSGSRDPGHVEGRNPSLMSCASVRVLPCLCISFLSGPLILALLLTYLDAFWSPLSYSKVTIFCL